MLCLAYSCLKILFKVFKKRLFLPYAFYGALVSGGNASKREELD